jgi:hypothetical protein
MILVLSELDGDPLVMDITEDALLELSLRSEAGAEARSAPQRSEVSFDAAWEKVRARSRHARHFADLNSALHFYRFGNHKLPEAEAMHVVRRLERMARAARVGA